MCAYLVQLLFAETELASHCSLCGPHSISLHGDVTRRRDRRLVCLLTELQTVVQTRSADQGYWPRSFFPLLNK